MKRILKFLTLGFFIGAVSVGQAAAATRGERAQARAASMPDAEWHEIMDTGPFNSDTFRVFGAEGPVTALKGIAVKVGPTENHTLVFDTEMLRMVAGFEGRVGLAGTPWDGNHGGNSYLPLERSDYYFLSSRSPGWSIDGDWSDPRPDGHGPLPRSLAKYRGLYRNGDEVLLVYTVGRSTVWEAPGFENGVLVRSFKVGPRELQLQLLVKDPFPANQGRGSWNPATHRLIGGGDAARLETLPGGRVVVTLDAGAEELDFQLVYGQGSLDGLEISERNLRALTEPGPEIYPETIVTKGVIGEDKRPYAVDTIPYPSGNPWFANTRFGAFDFFEDGDRAAASTWNGDVWIVSGLRGDLSSVRWKRFASGLFQTLGLKVVDGIIYTQGRDQITRLHDLNGDGEADFYENFNNDVKITDGFHEFSFDLLTDPEGNFWFSKGMPVLGGGRGFAPWTEHSGAILKVSPDGQTLERYAWGLRAPGGLGLGPNGEVTTGENEGSWVPRCKITWSKPGSFHGVVPSKWEDRVFVEPLPGAPDDYEKPLLWLPYDVDNSSGSQVWVPQESDWGPLHRGEMLHLSYGKSSIFRVLQEEVNGQVQGGVYKLPIDIGIPAQRGKFHPVSGAFYVMGLRGWQTNGGTGFQRVRYLGEAAPTPLAMQAYGNGMLITFSGSLDADTAEDARRYSVKKWNYLWGPQYGSGRFSIDKRDLALEERSLTVPSKGVVNNVDQVTVRAASLLPDGKSVFIYIPKMTPAMQMEIQIDLASTDGVEVRETIWNTIHNLRPDFQDHGLDMANLPDIPTAPIGEPGVTMTMAYSAESDKTVLDRVAFTVPSGTTVTPFMRADRPFETTFEATLAIAQRDEIAFKVEGEGEAVLQLDGEVLAEGPLPLESEARLIEIGGHDLYVQYTSQELATGRLKLMWSGKDFAWEPVPPAALLHTPDRSLDWGREVREGRSLFASAQCIQCHQSEQPLDSNGWMPELFESLPDLDAAGARFEAAWLKDWVSDPSGGCPEVAAENAADVAAYLADLGAGVESSDSVGDVEAGAALAKQLHMEPWIEGLAQTAKHTPQGLKAFLADPAAHHSDTTFPDFGLSEDEAGDIASYVLSLRPSAGHATLGDAVRGQRVVAGSCVGCHGEEDAGFAVSGPSLQKMWDADWNAIGCVSENLGQAPVLDLDAGQRRSLVKFRNVGLRHLPNSTPREYAERTLDRLGCVTCHSGDNKLPLIDQAGDKLRTDWLESLFKGEVKNIHPDIEARMPAFKSRARHLAVGIAAAHGSKIESEAGDFDAELAQIGGELGGVTGYACIACHAAGDTPALAAFEGQGPNLRLAGERLREDYYHRWMHWPQRVIPSTIMPKYTSVKGTALNGTVLGGSSDAQFDAIWHWLQTLREE